MVKFESTITTQKESDVEQIVVFTIDGQLYALPLKTVLRVIHIVEIMKLPKAPEIIKGIINVAGQIIPVVDVRKRFGVVTREIDPNDQLVIADTGKRKLALWVDTVNGVNSMTQHQNFETKEIMPFAQFIKGVAKIENDMILIYDLEQFLSLTEEMVLEQALLNKNK
jgi:purine-binding chemotaxis protein CheW